MGPIASHFTSSLIAQLSKRELFSMPHSKPLQNEFQISFDDVAGSSSRIQAAIVVRSIAPKIGRQSMI
jgi:hypothetical protein